MCKKEKVITLSVCIKNIYILTILKYLINKKEKIKMTTTKNALENRIARLKTNGKENANIVKKIERKLRKMK